MPLPITALYADSWLRANDPVQPAAVLDRTMASWPDSFELAAQRGIGHMMQHRREETERLFTHACRIIDDNELTHYNRGVCLLKPDRPEEAQEAFEQAVRFDPNHADAHMEFSRQLIQSGEHDRAREQLTTALQLVPDHMYTRRLLESLDVD